MKENRRNSNSSRSISIMILTITILANILVTFLATFYEHDYDEHIHWNLYVNDVPVGSGAGNNPYVNVGEPLNEGDVLRMETVLPDLGEISFPAFQMRAQYCAVQVLVDDLIYKEYDMDKYRKGSYIGANNYLVSLPEDYAGRRIQLRVHCQADNVSVPLYNLIFDSEPNLRYIFLHMVFLPISSGAVLLLLGGILLIISLSFSINNRMFLSHSLSALMTTGMGAMLHSHFGITAIYWDGMNVSLLYYVSSMLVLLVAGIWSGRILDKLYRFLHRCIIWTYGIYVLLRILLHAAGLLWIHEYFGLELVAGLFLLLPIFLDRRKAAREGTEWFDDSWKLQIFGMKASFLFDIVAYSCTMLGSMFFKDFHNLLIMVEIIALTGGMMIFPVCQLVNFLRFSTESFRRNEEFDDLTRVAFEDVLTRLPNRASLNRQVMSYENAKMDYTIVSIDVNGLKHTNDTYGHAEGDKLLKGFAQALKNVIGRNGFCCRTGGDEFLILIPESLAQAENDLLRLSGMLEEMNEREKHPWKYEAAYGCALRGEADSFHEAYLLADQRMYEKKRKQKAKHSAGEKNGRSRKPSHERG
ncbi:MAG: GGDEF domain-containing protein [Lachnospiraceae bacterium]|nr:GGDEF domain-containing protein [Lachnospiraceae bacterium]